MTTCKEPFVRFYLLSLVLTFCQIGLAGEFEVIPLNSTSEKVLKSSPLSAHVVSLDQSQKDFHQKTIHAFAKMKSFIDFNQVEPLDFIYDSHFLNEAAFIKKYSAISRSSLIKARLIASVAYRP